MLIASIANPKNPIACSLFLMSNIAHVEKKNGTKKCTKINAFPNFASCLFPLSTPHLVFLNAHYIFNKHKVLTLAFLHFTNKYNVSQIIEHS
jgi:hypothetical protein